MPDSNVSFSSIVKSQRSRGASRSGALATAAGQSILQAIDPRNYLFKRSGVLTSLFPSLRGYRPSTSTASSVSKSLAPSQVGVMTNQLDDIKMGINSVARNTMILPQLAKEMNIIRQNIVQLVKASGETPRQRASGFFQRAAGTEAEYESRLSGQSESSLSPTQIKPTEDSDKKGFFSNIFGGLFDMIKKPLMLAVGGLGLGYLLSDKFRNSVNDWFDGIFGSLLGEETWNSIKTMIGKLVEGLTSFVSFATNGALSMIGDPEKIKTDIKNVAIGGGLAVGGGILAKSALDVGVKKGTQALNSARISKKTKVISEQKKLQEEIFKRVKDPKTKSFLKFLLKKSPELFLKLAQRLVLSAGLLAIPVVGWIGAIFSLGLSLSTAYAIYQIYQAWQEESSNIDDTKPELIPQSSISPEVTQTIKTSPEQVMSEDFRSTGIDYSSYTKALAERESGGDLTAENTLGYVGRYQMGAMALEDVGLVKKGVGQKGNSALNDPNNWTEGLSKEKFLSSEDLQEQAMMAYTQLNFQRLKNKGLITNTTTPQQIASYLAASHLVGVGGFTSGKISDAYGTTVAEYSKLGAESQNVNLAENNINKGDMIRTMSESLNSNNFMADEFKKLGGILQLIAPQTNNQNMVTQSSGVKASVIDEELAKKLYQEIM